MYIIIIINLSTLKKEGLKLRGLLRMILSLLAIFGFLVFFIIIIAILGFAFNLPEFEKLKKEKAYQKFLIHSLPPKNKKVVYITFDLGNVGSQNVSPLLRLLERENVKATFFLTGKWTLCHSVSAIKIAKKGHKLANHSFTHFHQSEMSLFLNYLEVKSTEWVIRLITFKQPLHLYRPPHGDIDAKMTFLLESMGYKVIMWSKDPSDWRLDGSVSKKGILRKIGQVKSGDIIVFHLRNIETIQALEELIPRLKKEGFVFETLEKL